MAVNADVELGGTDQKFNVAMGRDLQRHFSKGTQFGLLLPILVGLDGAQKMSKVLATPLAWKKTRSRCTPSLRRSAMRRSTTT